MPNYKTKRFYPPQADDFIMVRRVACLSQKDVSAMLHVNLRTVINWESGRTTIPYAAFKLMRVLSRYELPGKTWEGWSVRDGALYNPAGRSFQSHELYYISNMFQMARYWIAEREQARNLAKQALPAQRQHLRLIQGGVK